MGVMTKHNLCLLSCHAVYQLETDITCTDRQADRHTDIYTWCVQVLRSPKEVFAAAMQSWRERCEKCVCLQGDYVEK